MKSPPIHADKAQKMAESLHLSDAEIQKRKHFLGLTAEDEKSLQILVPFFQQHVSSFVTLLHQRIERFPDTLQILQKVHSLPWLRTRHAEYFVELVSGTYDQQYVLNRLAVGISHQVIGLGPEWVQASFGLFLEWANRILREEPSSPIINNPVLLDNLLKITLFDSGLVMDSYFMAEREVKDVLSQVFDTNAEAVWILDEHWNIRHANRTSEKIIGWSPDYLKGKPIRDFIIPEEPSHTFPERMAEVARQDGHWQGELILVRHDGHQFAGWATVNLLDKKVSSGYILEFRDRTTEKKIENELLQKTAELLRSNRDLEQFAYVASHDLQEPLRMVTSYTQLLKRRYEGQLSQEADDFIKFAVDGAIRMQALINALLSYSRIETRGKALAKTSSSEVLGHALDNLKISIQESGAHIEINSLPEVHSDPVQLMQLFQNLIANAIKFRSHERSLFVTVSAERKGEFWEFTVSDNGIGIDVQYFERIFIIFQRLHTKEEYPGTGIGLALCKRIIERHGGTIGVRSTIGLGSSFYFTIRGMSEEVVP